jgi:hypothetical protein
MISFLSRDETSSVKKKLDRQIANNPTPKLSIHYENSPERDYSAAANLITLAAGDFSEAMVLFQFAVSGDGWDAHAANDERWARYRRWRIANQEDRRLFDAPGHQFDAHATEAFSQTIAFALDLGWDAWITVQPGRQLAFLSHDDRLEIYRGFNSRMLLKRLISLGYWRP